MEASHLIYMLWIKSEKSIEKCKYLQKDPLLTLCGPTLRKLIHGPMEVEEPAGSLGTRLSMSLTVTMALN